VANDVKRNDRDPFRPPSSSSGPWRVTATWHEQMAGARQQQRVEVRAAWRKVLACLAALAALAMAVPGPGDLVDALTSGIQGAGAAQNAVLLAAGVIVWGLLLWGLFVVAIAAFARLPGAGGRAARHVLHHIAPAAAGRLVIAAVGITAIAGVSGCAAPDGSAATVSVANLAASEPGSSTDPSAPTLDIDWPDAPAGGATAPPTTDPPATAPAPAAPAPVPTTAPATTTAAPSPVPASATATAPDAVGSTVSTPSPVSKMDAKPPPTPTAASTRPASTRPASAPPASTPPASTETPVAASEPTPTADGSVTVRPGDTLWAIAARKLPADATDVDIDTAWRAWYSANTEVIGADPDLIIPGQHLLPGDSETRPSP